MQKIIRGGVAALALASLSLCLAPLPGQAQNAAPAAAGPVVPPRAPAFLAYTFKPKDIGYHAPNKPVWHIADIVAAHKGQTDWEQPVVKDAWFFIQYISMGPGKKTPVSMQSDTIIWFIINSGQVRFNIKGQDPIVAGVDTMVSIPARIPYSIETLGNEPSIRFEVRNVEAGTVYPVADNPTAPVAPEGFETVQVNCGGCSPLPGAKARSFDYAAWTKANPTATQRPPFPDTGDNFFIRDPNGFTVPIRSMGTPMPPPESIGHFHLGLAEWWYALEGDMATRIEGAGDVYAHHGDLIYSPHGAYHQTVMIGHPSTRAASGKTGDNDSGVSFTKPGARGGE